MAGVSLIRGCRSVWHRLGTDNMKVDWLMARKLTGAEIYRYATGKDPVLRLRFWMVLNEEPQRVVDLVGRPGVDLEQLLRAAEAKPATIARTLCARLSIRFDQPGLNIALRVIRARSVDDRGVIMTLIGHADRTLFCELERKL